MSGLTSGPGIPEPQAMEPELGYALFVAKGTSEQ